MAKIKTFNTEDLLGLLRDCTHNLAMAHLETQENTHFVMSQRAYRACDYLLYVMQKQYPETVH